MIKKLIMNNTKRLDYIDRAKGFLILLVVIGHIWQAGPLFSTIYVFHMPAFFVISGMLLGVTKSYEKSFFTFVRRRVFSFGIPFLFIEFLGILTNIIRFGVTLSWKGYLFNTIQFQFNDPNLWFIVDLFLVEVFFVLLLRVVRNRWAICALIAILFFASFFLKSENAYLRTLTASCKYLPYFAFGFYGRTILEKRSSLITAASFAAVVAVGVFLGTRGSELTRKNLVIYTCGAVGTYFVLQIAKLRYPALLDKALSAAGRHSIIIYGTHHIIYATVGLFLGVQDYTSTPIGAGLIMLAVVCILEIPIIYIIQRWLPFLEGKHRHKKMSETRN